MNNNNLPKLLYTYIISFAVSFCFFVGLAHLAPLPNRTDTSQETTEQSVIIETDAGIPADAAVDTDADTNTLTESVETGPIILGTQTTTFQSYGRTYSNRARNIRLASRILNETVVEPGAEFSFNEIVGPRDRQHGFREAPTIMAGEMTESYGGGVCQVASTLFSAALYAGLTMTETRPHSHYMHYIDPGFDSTVSYDFGVDLKFRNEFDFPITIQSTVSEQNELTISILGREQIYTVSVDIDTRLRRRIEIQRIQNASLDPGRQLLIDTGTSRMRLIRTVSYTALNPSLDYQNREWVTIINYQPTPRIIEYN
jgi:vancomycin resistance protein YoaR